MRSNRKWEAISGNQSCQVMGTGSHLEMGGGKWKEMGNGIQLEIGGNGKLEAMGNWRQCEAMHCNGGWEAMRGEMQLKLEAMGNG